MIECLECGGRFPWVDDARHVHLPPEPPDTAVAELVAMGFPIEDVTPLVAEARAVGVGDIRRYVMRGLIR